MYFYLNIAHPYVNTCCLFIYLFIFICIHLSQPDLVEGILPHQITKVSTCGIVWWSLKKYPFCTLQLARCLHLAALTCLWSKWWSLQLQWRCTDITHLWQVCLPTKTMTMNSHRQSGKMYLIPGISSVVYIINLPKPSNLQHVCSFILNMFAYF